MNGSVNSLQEEDQACSSTPPALTCVDTPQVLQSLVAFITLIVPLPQGPFYIMGIFADAFIQSDLQPHILTPTAELTMQGDSQLVRSSQGERSCRDTSTLSYRSRGSNPLYLPSCYHPQMCRLIYLLQHMHLAHPFRQISSRPSPGQTNDNRSSNMVCFDG